MRSRNWSGSTMSHGWYLAWSEPTALTLMIQATPSFFMRPDVGAVVQLAGQNAVAAPVPRQEHHLAPGQLAGEEIVRGRAEGRFDLHPLLVGEAFDVIKPAAADDADTILRHARGYSG